MRVVHHSDAYLDDIGLIVEPRQALANIRSSLRREPGCHPYISGLDSMLCNRGLGACITPHQVDNLLDDIAPLLEQGDYLLLDGSGDLEGVLFFERPSPFLSSELQRKLQALPPRPKWNASAYNKELPAYDIQAVLDDPSLDAISSVNIDPASMLVEGIADTLQAASDFIENPSVAGFATLAAAAIPGRYAEKVTDGVTDKVVDLVKDAKAKTKVDLDDVGSTAADLGVVPNKALVSPAEVNWNTSRALGMEISDPRDYAVGQQMFESLQQAGVSPDRALRMSRDMLESGVDLPSSVSLLQGDQLFKLVPTGSPPSGSTPYFVTGDVLERLPNNPQAIGERLGLPQVPSSFELYSVTAKSNVDVFQSQIAKFSVNSGEHLRSGGEIQTLVTRRDLFTEAQPLNRYITGQ